MLLLYAYVVIYVNEACWALCKNKINSSFTPKIHARSLLNTCTQKHTSRTHAHCACLTRDSRVIPRTFTLRRHKKNRTLTLTLRLVGHRYRFFLQSRTNDKRVLRGLDRKYEASLMSPLYRTLELRKRDAVNFYKDRIIILSKICDCAIIKYIEISCASFYRYSKVPQTFGWNCRRFPRRNRDRVTITVSINPL